MAEVNSFDDIAKTIMEGNLTLGKTSDNVQALDVTKNNTLKSMKQAVRQLDAIRTAAADRVPVDMSMDAYAKEKWGFADFNALLRRLGIDANNATVHTFTTMEDYDEGYRWLIPEIIRTAIRSGMPIDPLWRRLIVEDIAISEPSVTMPVIERSDAVMSKLGEGQTIPTGTLSFDQKKVGVQKYGVGIKVTDEVLRYVKLPILNIYFQDMGTLLTACENNLAIQTAINGDGVASAAPVIGVDDTTEGIQYKDMLRAWIRLGMISRQSKLILTNENMALNMLTLPEITNRQSYLPGINNELLKLQTPVPTVQDVVIDGGMPVNNQVMFIDTSKAMIRLSSMALRMESERIAEKQISGTYATMEFGFANLFTDARLIIDQTLAFSSNGFPSYMDYASYVASLNFRRP